MRLLPLSCFPVLVATALLASPSRVGEPAARPPRPGAVPQGAIYTLSVRILPESKRIVVAGTMTLPASDTVRASVGVVLVRMARGVRFDLRGTMIAADTVPSTGADVRWRVRRAGGFPAGEPVVLSFSYSCEGETAPFFHVSPEITIVSAWGTNWYPLPEGSPDGGTGTLHVRVPAGYTAVAGPASESTDAEEREGSFRFRVRHSTYFTLAAARFTVVRAAGSVPITAYLLRPRAGMEQYLAGVDSVQRVLGAHFGPYPFPQLSLVEFPRPLAQRVGFNAAGLPGLVLGNDRMFDVPMEHLAAVYGHELSHMWFPHVVSLRGAEGRYLEESLAQFGAARVIEALRGSDAAERARRTSDDVYYGAEEYFKLVARGADAPLAALARGADSHQLAYSKGGLVWEMLAREVGADLFRRTLMGVTERHGFGQITFAELLDEIETGAGRELDWFYDQWFRRAGAPEWTLSWRQRGATVRGTLVQPAPAYRASVELRLTGTRGETQMHRVEVRALRTGFAVPAAFRVRAVEVDPHYRLLRWSPEYRALVDSVVAAGRR